MSVTWWSALAAIIVIDLVLAGDNALVIGIAASRLRPDLRKKAIIFGAAGAIGVRTVLTLVVVWLLQIPGLLVLGGALLLPIAYKLAVPSEGEGDHNISAADNFWAAMRTIVIADALMGIDNVLAVGGAAQGRWDLVILGLLISIPLVVWGSTFIARLIERYPLIISVGSSILALTAVNMITKDPLFDTYVVNDTKIDIALQAVATIAMFAVGYRAFRRSQSRQQGA